MSRSVAHFPRSSFTRLATLFVATVALTAACGGGGGSETGGNNTPVTPVTPTGPVATTAVTLQNTAFSPTDILVSPSATVTFNNLDGFNHNVTFSDATIGTSGDFANGTKSLVMPATAGTYAFHCTIHPGMTGTVKVQ